MTTDSSQKRRLDDGGTYLVIADDTPEFTLALNYAVRMARRHRGHVAMAKIIEPYQFTGWRSIQQDAKDEGRAKAEAELLALSQRIKEESGLTPTFLIREGNINQEIIAAIKGNPAISAFVLATSTTSGKPGPLVTYFSTKGLMEITVPVILVPGHVRA